MSNIHKAFRNGKAFIGFAVGGDPTLEKTEEYILEMIRAGADLIEIGVPFSDPIAEGQVIQQANIRALASGTTVDKLFDLVARIRKNEKYDYVPLVFLTYLNPVFHYGYEKFFDKCQSVGLDGIIIPDLPFEEQAEVRDISDKYSVDLISLIAPTSESRIAEIAKNAVGFLYIVSSMGVTGVRGEISTNLSPILDAVKSVSNIPTAIGFGINTPEQAAKIAEIADGVIVGSAIVKIIEKHGDQAGAYVYEYVRSLKEAIRN
jgi:tryptophan synthase alpha chain